jgi:hypothetical protein
MLLKKLLVMWGWKLVGENRRKRCQLCNYITDNILEEIQPFPVSGFGQKAFGNEKNYQPVSRILFPRWCGRSSFIWSLHYCRGSSCLPSGAAPCGASGGPPSIAGIRGISACKVYPPRQLPAGAVGSYPTFSTSPLAGQLFSVALSVDA